MPAGPLRRLFREDDDDEEQPSEGPESRAEPREQAPTALPPLPRAGIAKNLVSDFLSTWTAIAQAAQPVEEDEEDELEEPVRPLPSDVSRQSPERVRGPHFGSILKKKDSKAPRMVKTISFLGDEEDDLVDRIGRKAMLTQFSHDLQSERAQLEEAKSPMTGTLVDALSIDSKKSTKSADSARRRATCSLRLRVFEKVKGLSKRHRQKLEIGKKQEWNQILRKQFNDLPPEETAALERTFHAFDVDDSGRLEGAEITACLGELGLKGTNSAEKSEIQKSLKHLLIANKQESPGEDAEPEVDFLDFAVRVVPQIRQRLQELRTNQMLRLFLQYDALGFGNLRVDQCMEIVRTMGLDQRRFGRVFEEIYGTSKATLEFQELQHLVSLLKERSERVVREHERHIKQKTGISHEVFLEFRSDLINMYDLFMKADDDGNGVLTSTELMRVLSEFGLLPRTAGERDEVELLIREADGDGNFVLDFTEFLHLTSLVRQTQVEKKRAQNVAVFERYDKDGNGQLSMEEISSMLTDLGIVPSDRKEQEELASLIQQVDSSMDGFIDFEEFEILCQRIDERLKSIVYEQEVEYALRLGFSENQLFDLRWAFDTLDTDSSSRLDVNEVKAGLAIMKKHVTQEAFEAAFAALDIDGNGELDFQEYLDFMKLLRDGEGLFNEDGTRLPAKVRFMELRVLRRALEYFGMSKSYIASLTKHESIDLFCFFFGLKPGDSLHEKFHVYTISEFLDIAKSKGLEKQRTGTSFS